MESKQEQRHKNGETTEARGPDVTPVPAEDSVLRRLVGRLCLAGLGRSPELDAQLKHISQLARSGLDVAGIQLALEPLTRAVTALDEPAAWAAGVTVSTPVLKTPQATLAATAALAATASLAVSAPAPAALTADSSPEHDELRQQREQLQREKAEIEELLRQLDSHLETLASFFAHEEENHTSTRTDTDRLNTLVLGEVREISNEISADCSLVELRHRVGNRLNSISNHISDFRDRSEHRQVEQTSRMRALKVRVDQLERESRTLQHSLREEQRLALIDTLTGIPNRAAWDERIASEYANWQRHDGVVSLLVWDVDHFKSINDEYGHKAGDKMLRVLAQHLARELRQTDFVARYGGEEFVMLFAQTTADETLKIANRIRTRVPEIAFHFRETRVMVTLSCGITTFRMGDTPDTAFERADRALYAAKDAGRNRCVVR